MKHEILILGGNHQNPLGVIEALGRKGLRSHVIVVGGCKKSFVLRSKYVKRGWICGSYEEALSCIREQFSQATKPLVAYACSDDAASFFDCHRDELSQYLLLPGIAQQGALTRWIDKQVMVEAAQRLGLDTPRTWIVDQASNFSEILYPCVTKSLTSVQNGKSEFTLCQNEAELRHFLQHKAHNQQIQVQQFIEKEYEFQFLGLSLQGGEQVFIPGRTHIGATPHFNNLTFLRYAPFAEGDNPATLEKSRAFVRATGYTGLFSVEFMHGKDGRDYFLEMNFRNDGNGICVTSAGTNLPYIFYLYATGGDYQGEIASSEVKETYCTPEDSYLMLMLNGEIGFKEWCKNMKRATCYVTYFKGNTKPFWSLMWLQKRPIVATAFRRLLKTLHLAS